MTRKRRLDLLKQIEQDVCRLGSSLSNEVKAHALRQTIEELEQRSKVGHWTRQKNYCGSTYICSVCNKGVYLIGYPAEDFKEHSYNYCPNCSAKMEGHEE